MSRGQFPRQPSLQRVYHSMPKKTPGILFQVLLMSSGTTSHPLLTMPKNWDMYKNEIEDRYMKRGQTLLSVKNFIKEKYGFEASTRAYRMRLGEWQMRKNKCKLRSARKPDDRFSEESWEDLECISTPTPSRESKEIPTPMAITMSDCSIFSSQPGPLEPMFPATGNTDSIVSHSGEPPSAMPSMEYPESTANLQAPLQPTSTTFLVHSPLESTPIDHTMARTSFQSPVGSMPVSCLTQSPPTSTSTQHTKSHTSFQNPLVNMVDDEPLANLSFMFFSIRPLHESLERLANAPLMAPLALEILLRNWKTGSNCLDYALRFVEDGSYCTAILSMNWTRWWHNDETLFDLVEDNVPKDEQNLVIKAFLKADLKFHCQLGTLCAPWASEWRLAIQQEEWVKARRIVMNFEASNRLRRCALGVIAEKMLAIYRDHIELESSSDNQLSPSAIKAGASVFSAQYLEILQDGRERRADINSSWYKYASDRELEKCTTSQIPAGCMDKF